MLCQTRYELETRSTPTYEYGEHAGLKLPRRGGVIWQLPEGNLKYADITITQLEYNVARCYREQAARTKAEATGRRPVSKEVSL